MLSKIKEGEWKELRHETVTQSAEIVGNTVTIQGSVISVSPGIFRRVTGGDDGPPEESLKFGLDYDYNQSPADPEKLKRFATYASHLMRLLRAADYGDDWSIAKLDQLVAEEPPYVEENRKAQAEHQAFLAELRAKTDE